MAKTANDVYLELYRRLKDSADPQPSLTARELTAYACRADKDRTAGWAHIYMDNATVEFAHSLCSRCIDGEPLAYILGEWDFYGHTFHVDPTVLIPRQETERLCEIVITKARSAASPKILDLCCGSGCIGIAAAIEVGNANVTGVDISESALNVSKNNARRLGVIKRYNVFRADVKKDPPIGMGKYDIIVSNPPYVSAADMENLDKSVSEFEPVLALYGGEDGLDFYPEICSRWKKLLEPGGMMIFECGEEQTELIAGIMYENDFVKVKTERDFAGRPRYVRGFRQKDI